MNLDHRAIDEARQVLIDLIGSTTPLGQIETHVLHEAMESAIRAYEACVFDEVTADT